MKQQETRVSTRTEQRVRMARRRPLVVVGLLLGLLAAGSGAARAQTAALDLLQPAPGRGILQPFALQDTSAAGATSLRTPESYVQNWCFLRTMGEIVAFNLVMTTFGRLFMESNEGFIVTFESIHENLKAGFEWDDNTFSANNFRHPWQGGMYFEAARSNNYDFYESSMYSFAGAWLWEYTGENHHPSVNDWLNTAVGGIAFGEALHRLSNMVLDNTATKNRAWRETAGLLVSPVRGVNRLLTGEAFEVHANPPDRFPEHRDGSLRFGVRTIGDERLWERSTSKLFVSFDTEYGSPFTTGPRKPYDAFTFGMQLNFDNKPHGIGRIEIDGLLGAMTLSKTARAHHLVGAYQHFDYIDNEAYVFGGQSVGACYLTRFTGHEGVDVRASLHVNAILLGASKSDHFNISGREYDYGPGAGFEFTAVFAHKDRDILTLAHESTYIHSVNGNEVESYSNFTRLRANVPIRSFFGTGLEYLLYHSRRDYAAFPDVDQRSPEMRVYVKWGG